MRTFRALPLLLVPLSVLPALGCSSYERCSEIPAARWENVSERLSATGLFADASTDTLAPGVRAYRPEFELWSDGASKRRWVFLPPDAAVDSADMDAWQFPTGTKFWKEFTSAGVRVETRLLQKMGPNPGDWLALSYIWSEDGQDAYAAPAGRENARGTTHDVPSAALCMGCHGGTRGHVLGFSAVQLAHDAPPAELNLSRLLEDKRLSVPPARFPKIPGDERSRRALGYLHANCSHCHNQHRPERVGPRCFDPQKEFDLSLRTDELASVSTTGAYRTALGNVIEPRDPDGSAIVQRVEGTNWFGPRMPPLATEAIDRHGVQLLRAWITSLSE